MIKQLDLHKSEQYTLSIRLSADGFSFSIYNPIEQYSFEHINYRIEPNISLTANIKKALSENDFLKLPFKRVNILMDTPHYTTVPLDLFEEKQVEIIYYQNHPKHFGEIISYNILKRSNCVNLFAMDKNTHNLLYENFPQATLYTTVSPIIEYLCDRSKLGNIGKMYAYIKKRHIDITVFDKGRLLFINTFPNKGITDCIYFILNVWKHVALNQETDELHLIGNSIEKKGLTEELHKYIKNVSFIPPITTFSEVNALPNNEVPFDVQALLMSNL